MIEYSTPPSYGYGYIHQIGCWKSILLRVHSIYDLLSWVVSLRLSRFKNHALERNNNARRNNSHRHTLVCKVEGWQGSESMIRRRIRIVCAFWATPTDSLISSPYTPHVVNDFGAWVTCTQPQSNIGLQPHRPSVYPSAQCMQRSRRFRRMILVES